jgi:archaellum component FlaD/FlaE
MSDTISELTVAVERFCEIYRATPDGSAEETLTKAFLTVMRLQLKSIEQQQVLIDLQAETNARLDRIGRGTVSEMHARHLAHIAHGRRMEEGRRG